MLYIIAKVNSIENIGVITHMPDINDWNRQTIEEFRANEGRVGGFWEGRPLLLLTTTGAKSGKKRTTPTMYLHDGDRLLIFASKRGAPTNPAWYHNLIAHPKVTVEVGHEKFEATATVLKGEERDRFYAKQAELYPQFGEYQERTTRKIPVVALVRQKG
jgi:deazaflavin-dependent oxidoreductase (nitroreductase family)